MENVPSRRKLHKAFYGKLRKLGFRAHHTSEIYKRAREVVKAAKESNGSKPVLRRLTARVSTYDYRVDFNTGTLRVAVLNNHWVELRLKLHKHLGRYLDGSWRLSEVQVSYRGERVYVYLTFNREVELKEPKAVMGVDVNFNNITYTIVGLDGSLVSTGVVPLRGLCRALHFKKLSEELQKRYPRSWRFLKWARRARSRWLRRASSILVDSSHYIAKRLVKVAGEYSAAIVLEDLEKLKNNKKNNSRLSWESHLWCYRRVQACTEYKALLKGVRVVYVNPRGKSKRSPNGKPLVFINYRFAKLGGTITTRDVVASWNLALRELKQMRGSRVRWSPDSPRSEAVKNELSGGTPRQPQYSQVIKTICLGETLRECRAPAMDSRELTAP